MKNKCFNYMAALVAVIIGSVAAGCGDGGEDPQPSFVSNNGPAGICTTCAALTATPTAGVAECKGACKKVPAAGDSFKCVTVNGQEKCVPAGEVICSGGIDEDVDGMTDCGDVADCGGKQCGVGANGIKTCSPAGACVDGPCVPVCTAKVCGNDGCNGSCGACQPGNECNNVGQCVIKCVPQCAGKQCGGDGCGGQCGTCAAGLQCNAANQCVIPPCVPQCAGKQCGPDSCGGQCGQCAGGQQCNNAGQCFVPCAPNCGAKVCGGDGCNGSCGQCLGNTSCSNAGQCLCTPQCAGKQCGADGCGGQCGQCAAGQVCNAANQCVAAPCVPNCANKQCGSDGCGGQCGQCLVAQQCSAQTLCFPTAVTEVCDDGVDNDLDGKVDVSDIPWCDDKKVATLGLSFTSTAFVRVVTGAIVNGQPVSWEGNMPANFTLSLDINGKDMFGKVWVSGTNVQATSPQGFIAWDAPASVAPPNWPGAGVQGFPVPKGGSYSVNQPVAGWVNFYYAGASQ